ncbi:MAG: DNA-binding response regulator [Bacteroidetes bacterium QS_8_68_28]|jgi:DNA-binding response OmpR family regulator|nr:MAG: DNA-binding response regulator [Bacteroidetes bacterium QS_8_68_28]
MESQTSADADSQATTARMLIVEDDPEMSMGLEDFFELKGYDVERAEDGDEGLQQITSLPPYDVVLLDVMLPEKNGFDILREARQGGVDSPVIMLSVKGKEEDKLQGFELGADDYVTKPFSAEELEARVKAVLERSGPSEKVEEMERFSFGDVEVDFEEQVAHKNDEEIQFTALEFDILRYFIHRRGRTVSRKQLLRDVWGISGDITTRTIDRHVASLRKKIEPDPTAPTYIETVYGIGYKFVGDDGG